MIKKTDCQIIYGVIIFILLCIIIRLATNKGKLINEENYRSFNVLDKASLLSKMTPEQIAEKIAESKARNARLTEKIDPEIEAQFKAVDIKDGFQVDAKGCTKNMYQHGICVFDLDN